MVLGGLGSDFRWRLRPGLLCVAALCGLLGTDYFLLFTLPRFALIGRILPPVDVSPACLNCRSRKMKCTGEQPICLNVRPLQID